MTHKEIAGVDIGGTKIAAGLIKSGRILKKYQTPTQTDKTSEQVLQNIYRSIEQVITPKTVGIGIGIPGNVDSVEGKIYNLANIPVLNNLSIKADIENKFGIETRINNDANCFVLAVKYFRKKKGLAKTIVGLSLGTGLGAGLIVEDKLFTGLGHAAGEFGMIPYKESNIEMYCSGKFFTDLNQTNGEQVYIQAINGNKEALDLWEEFGVHIAHLVKIILYAYSPGVIAIGGSVAKGFAFFESSMKSALKDYQFPRLLEHITIYPEIQNDFAILGAGALFFD